MSIVIDQFLPSDHSHHPYANISPDADYHFIMRNFFAMSQAFPYLQAGAQQPYIFKCMEENADIPVEVEMTSVVGNFLCWDETGGLYPTLAQGLKALPRILETHRFHANILRKDIEFIFGEALKPDYSQLTNHYLRSLFNKLSSFDHIERAANMISFEAHAEHMITALWESLCDRFQLIPKDLGYFNMHVGGDDPAEVYHVQMTQSLLEKLVTTESDELKMGEAIKNAYELNRKWCQDVVDYATSNQSASLSSCSAH
jgi:hypothetical protein